MEENAARETYKISMKFQRVAKKKKKRKNKKEIFWKSLLPNVIIGSVCVPKCLSCTSVYYFFNIIYVDANLFIITFCVLLGTPTE